MEHSISPLLKALKSLATRIPKIVLQRVEEIYPALCDSGCINLIAAAEVLSDHPNSSEKQSTISQTSRSPEIHVVTNGNLKTCALCKKSFSLKSKCISHIRAAHYNLRPYTCVLCNKNFRTATHLKYHQAVHYNLRSHSCVKCNKNFKRKGDLRRHQATHILDRKKEICHICNASFLETQTLKSHLLRHQSVRPFPCNVCQKTFVKASELKTHQMYHTDERPYTCELCNKSFITKCNYLSHKNIVHNRKIPYECDICKAKFKSIWNLKRHIAIHTGEIKVICPICKQIFHRGSLKKHLVTHEGERKYKCSVCDKSFYFERYLKAHSKTHNKGNNIFVTSVIKPSP